MNGHTLVMLCIHCKNFTLRNYGKVLYGMVIHNTYTHFECITIFKMLQLTIQGLLSIQAYEEVAKEIQKQYEKAVTNGYLHLWMQHMKKDGNGFQVICR